MGVRAYYSLMVTRLPSRFFPRRLLAAAFLVVAVCSAAPAAEAPQAAREAAIRQSMMQLIIPKLEFREATVREALEFLTRKIAQLYPTQPGLNYVLSLPVATGPADAPSNPSPPGDIPGLVDPKAAALAAAPPEEPGITLSLTNIPLWEALRYVAEIAHLQMKVGERALELSPQEKPAAKAGPAPAKPNDIAPPAGPLAGKLQRIVIPVVTLREAPLTDALNFVKFKASQLDATEPKAGLRGINIVYVPRPPSKAAPPPLLTLDLANAPVGEVLRTLAHMADLDMAVEEYAVVLRERPAHR